MNQWIVKAGTLSAPQAWTSKPMSMTEAGKLAETLANASGFYCDVTVEFYGEQETAERIEKEYAPLSEAMLSRSCSICEDIRMQSSNLCRRCSNHSFNIDEECARA